MQRLRGWEQRLATLLSNEQAAAFSWGDHDCATLAFSAIRAVTGEDLGRDVPRWFSRRTAFRSMRHAGAASATEFFARRLPEIAVAEAGRGDLVVPVGKLDALACPAVLAGAVAMSRNETGWVVMPRSLAARAFRVG